jgi:hypothetical protein
MKLNIAVVTGALVGVMCAGHSALSAGVKVDEEMPRALQTQRQDQAVRVWVDSRDVVTEAGQFNEDAFLTDPIAARMVKSVISSPMVGGCVSLGPTQISRVNPPARASVPEAVKTANLVLLGRVIGRSYGFFGGVPGQLLKLLPEEIVKGSGDRPDAVFAFLPVGEFSVGNTRICKSDNSYAKEPALGDRALVFSATPLGAKREILDPVDDGGLLFIPREGTAYLPKRYLNDKQAIPSASDLLGLARAAARPVAR